MTSHSLAIAVAVALVAQPSTQNPQFKSSIDLVQVDVSAVDGNGRPIRGLTADDFVLRVDGKRRRIVSAQFIAVDTGADIAPAMETPPHYSSNAQSPGGRLITIVVDRGSITAGRGKGVMEAAAKFVAQLNRADRVALASIPRGPQVDFTADHALVQGLLAQIDGDALPPLGIHKVGITDALAFERKDQLGIERILQRECGVVATSDQRGGGNSDVVICSQQVALEASQMAVDARHKARDSIAGLRALIERIPPSPTPKVIVFISEGLVTANEASELSWLQSKAAAAHITLYALHLQASEYDPSQRRPPATTSDDRAALEEGLYLMTQVTRGDVFRVVSNSDFAFQRLSRELSGYYLLSFEPEPGERNGRAHDIEVDVRRQGATVRSRRQFTIGPTVVRTAAGDITALLRDPLPASEIPIRVTTYSFREPHSERIRLLIAADIDRSVNSTGELAVGYVLVDFGHKLAASQLDTQLPATARRDGPVQHYFSTALVDRGRYTLKLAVVDDGGRRGTIERVLRAQLSVAGPFRVTDLLIADSAGTDGGIPPAPTVEGRISGPLLHAYMELFSDAPELLDTATVTLEVAATETSPALQSVPVPLRATEDASCRIAGASVSLADLTAGDYVARAVISAANRRVGLATRPFTVTRASASK